MLTIKSEFYLKLAFLFISENSASAKQGHRKQFRDFNHVVLTFIDKQIIQANIYFGTSVARAAE